MRHRMLSALFVTTLIAGCAMATGPAPQATSSSGLSAGNAQLSVKMSSSIFLQPVGPRKRVVFLDGHNTSSAQNLHFAGLIRQRLKAKGYRITNDPHRAQYMLMWNVLYIGKETKAHTVAGALGGGFGGALIGNAIGGNSTGATAGALAGALVGAIAAHYLAAHKYMMVVDIQLEQRERGAVSRSETNSRQGLGNSTMSRGGNLRGWMVFRDRIVAQAKGMRLTFNYAVPALTKEVSSELAGVF